MQQINFMEFYQQALILIGTDEKKRLGIIDKGWREEPLDVTHYLIALEGTEENQENPQSEIYHWKVTVYLADSEGSFYSEKPIYTSKYFDSIHCAFSAARRLEETGKCGHLLVRYCH